MSYNVDSDAIVEVSWLMTLAGQRVMIVRHYKVTMEFGSDHDGPTALDQLQQQIDSVGGLGEFVAGAMSSDVAIDKVRYQWIYPTRYAYRSFNTVFPNGTLAAGSAPPGTSGAITLQADTTGRHSRGTLHMPGVPRADIALGYIGDPTATAYADLIDPLRQVQTTDGGQTQWQPIIFNRAQPQFSAEVTHGTAQIEARTMSRRVVGRGS